MVSDDTSEGSANTPSGGLVTPRLPLILIRVFLCAGALLTAGSTVHAQTITGAVVEGSSDAPVAGAVVRLLDAAGEIVSTTLADTVGLYMLEAPSPGRYVISAERLGFHPFESMLLSVSNPDGTYAADLEMTMDPIELQGITVRAEERAELRDGLRRVVGLNLKSLARDPIDRAQLVSHVERAHDLGAMLRWSQAGAVRVQDDPIEGPCFSVRGRRCLPIFLDGDFVPRNIADVVPLDMLEYVVILNPNESVQYPGGAVLLYTFRWLWWNR